IQLDLKIDGISEDIIRATLDQARDARREILKHIVTTLRYPRAEPSPLAPRRLVIQTNPEKIGMLIGPGGKNIKAIQEGTGAKIDIDDDGTVYISHASAAGAEQAKAKVEAITEEVKIGKVYEGRVTSVKDFGAFIEILPGRDGLCHISELDDKFVDKVENVCRVGDKLQVKVMAIDGKARIKLPRKVWLREARAAAAPPQGPGPHSPAGGPHGPGGGRGPRGDDRRD